MAPGHEPSLESLACAVADGSAVDWADAESGVTSEDERRVVRQLRLLGDVAAAARALSAWGPLRLRGEVGSGAFGTVYRAWDPRLEREVALKLLPPLPGASSAGLVREGRLLARIRHPNVVTVFGADEYDGRPGIWMEFIEGRTLKALVDEQGPLGPSEAGLIGIDLCRALAAVHRQGVVHRDVKAQNVMREVGGRTVLMDFGAGDALADGGDQPLRGTPAYLAPELLEGQPADVRTDLYSLGVLLFYLVSGQFPVTAGSLSELRERHAAGARTLLPDLRPDAPAPFVHVVDACLSPRRVDRPVRAQAQRPLEPGLDGGGAVGPVVPTR